MFETSANTEKLVAALAKAQGQFEAAKKDSLNPHFKSKYADLSAVWDACRDPLTKSGIVVTQWPVHSTDGHAWLLTRVAFEDQWMQSVFSVPAQPTAQGYKSAITYLKRICLEAALGIATEEDDDGNAAVGEKLQQPRQGFQPKAAQPKAPQAPTKPPNFAPKGTPPQQPRLQPKGPVQAKQAPAPEELGPEALDFLNSPMPNWGDK